MAPYAANSLPSPPPNIENGAQCTDAKWYNILLFYFANFIAHCATVKPYPAETMSEIGLAIAAALFLPSSGVARALDSVVRRTRFRKEDELNKAAIAGCLCIVVRSGDWKMQAGDRIHNLCYSHVVPPLRRKDFISTVPAVSNQQGGGERNHLLETMEHEASSNQSDSSNDRVMAVRATVKSPPWLEDDLHRTSYKPRSIKDRGCDVHGIYSLPEGYEFAYLPGGALIGASVDRNGARTHQLGGRQIVSSSYSFTKAALAIVQTVYGSVSLYRARGYQIQRFGYSAYGLTVIPYILMSIMNLLGQIATADYPTLYMVHSEEMDEARRRGGYFDGVIGTLIVDKGFEEEAPSELVPMTSGPWVVGDPIKVGNKSVFLLDNESWTPNQDRGLKALKVFPYQLGSAQKQTKHQISIPSCTAYVFRKNNKLRWSNKFNWVSAEWARSRRVETSSLLVFVAPLVLGLVSLTLVGALSGFERGTDPENKDRVAERGFTMSWLVVGMLFGAFSRGMIHSFLYETNMGSLMGGICAGLFFLLMFGIFLVPALGGFIVVGKMMYRHGSCVRVD